MTKILFLRNEKTYLPEISAYKNYMAERLPSFSAYDSRDMAEYDPMDFDIIWHFMGIDWQGKGRTIIHEYNSLSTGMFPRVKNFVKKQVNKRPDMRIFLNDIVRKSFAFSDDVPFRVRDMGIDKSFFDTSNHIKADYDFIYAGSMNRETAIIPVLDQFRNQLKNASIVLVGDPPETLRKRYQDAPNIVFAGRVRYEEVPQMLRRARYGINLMPDTYPFNRQTATKVLEYCAAGLPVITSDYHWARKFANKKKAKFFFLEGDLRNFTMEAIDNHDFSVPDVQDYEWKRVIEKSKIFDLIQSKL